MEVRELPMDGLVPSRNLRTEGVDVTELAESIREHGLLQPIRVRPIGSGMYQIIAGHRRYMAHRLLGRHVISAVIVQESDQAAAVQGIVENLQREDLTPLELAQGVRELASSFGLNIEQIARSTSKSTGQVRTWMRLARLPEEVLARLESGEGRTQAVTGLTPRHLQPFVSDMPSEEEVERDAEAAARFAQTVATVSQFQQEVESRGARVNAHMADEIARRTRSGQVPLVDAIDEVLAHPEKYRYGKAPETAEELEMDTWAAYVRVHQELLEKAHKLRPEIASAFSDTQRLDLLQRLSTLYKVFERYRKALSGDQPSMAPELPVLPAGQSADNQ